MCSLLPVELTRPSLFASLSFRHLAELMKSLFIHVFSVCFGGCRILAEQQKADREVNKGKRYFTNPFAHSV